MSNTKIIIQQNNSLANLYLGAKFILGVGIIKANNNGDINLPKRALNRTSMLGFKIISNCKKQIKIGKFIYGNNDRAIFKDDEKVLFIVYKDKFGDKMKLYLTI